METPNLMPNLLENPDPPFHMEKGDRGYVAVSNAAGGATLPAAVLEKDWMPDGKQFYVIEYRDQAPPYRAWKEAVLAANLFRTLDEAAAARRDDGSLQILRAEEACSTPEGLVRYLLSHTCLEGSLYRAAVRSAERLGLYGEPDQRNEERGHGA